MNCPTCGRELPPDVTTCPQCAAAGTPAPPPVMFSDTPGVETAPARTSGVATAALVLGLCSLVFTCFTALPGLVLGIIALVQIGRSQGRLKGTGMAVTGIVTSLVLMLLLPAVLLPVFSRAREKPRHGMCTNNLKQLATQMQILVQEGNQQLPGADWVKQLGIESPKALTCPSAGAKDGETTYGYNGLLLALEPGAPGINEQAIIYTTEVGAFADAGASSVKAPGILSGGGCLGAGRAVKLDPRHDGVIVAFVDGHAKYCPGKTINERDAASHLTRAFCTAPALGIVQNFGGGYAEAPDTTVAGDITIGGEYCGRPLVGAIGELYKATGGGRIIDRGFRGGMYPLGLTAMKTEYLWATTLPGNTNMTFEEADLTPPADTVTVAYQPIARDAVVIIVPKKSRLTGSAEDGARQWISPEAVRNAFANGARGRVQCYLYDPFSETRRFFDARLGITTVGKGAQVVGSDAEMVEKVSQDPYGIGYCSLAMADPERVDILALGADGPSAVYLPNPQPSAEARERWVFPATPPATYALTRTIYLKCVGKQAVKFKADYHAAGASYKRVLEAGPLFKASYWLP